MAFGSGNKGSNGSGSANHEPMGKPGAKKNMDMLGAMKRRAMKSC